MASSELIKAIAATAELCNKVFTPVAAKLFADDLEGYDEQAILKALSRCRKELKGPLTLEAVISRIEDGRPGVEEAWAMLPHDESATVVWTNEMSEAWGIALPLLNASDVVAARMAFKEAYTKAITLARDQKKPVKWTASLGHDKNGREHVLTQAVALGRLPAAHVKALLPSHEVSPQMLAYLQRQELKLISSK